MLELGCHTLVEALLAADSPRPFLTFWWPAPAERTFTYYEFRADAARFATLLSQRGVAAGDRVVLVMEQSPS